MNPTRRKFLNLALAGCAALTICGCQKKKSAVTPPDVDYFTCAMHPSVHQAEQGKCPICGMDLIPVMKRTAFSEGAATVAASGPTEFTISTDRQQQVGVTYANAERRRLRRAIRAVGSVEYDRQRAWAFVARTDGYVKKLFVTSPGELVAKQQPLLSLYSPDLFTAEREYVMLLGMRAGAPGRHEHDMRDMREMPDSLLASARGRLAQWSVTSEEIAQLEKTRQPEETVTLYSPFRGVVREVAAEQGGNVKTGDKLVEVADLSQVWVWADFYETELDALRKGLPARVRANSSPGDIFEGEVSLIDPFLDAARRTFKVRIDIPNPDMKLRPGMYVDVTVESDAGDGLAIPVNAVIPTGTRTLVFVDKGEGRLEPRAVTLGPEFDGYYEVRAGLRENERIVASATFLIDAEAQLQGALKSFDSGSPARQTEAPQ